MESNELSDFLKLLGGVLGGVKEPVEHRRVALKERTGDNVVGVSTVWTTDMGFETALEDTKGFHPVERYATKELARLGHEKWVEFAEDGIGKKVIKLGYGSIIESEEITLEGGK